MRQPFLPLIGVFGSAEIANLFSEEALVESYLTVERALAMAQSEIGVIPASAAAAIETEATIEKIDFVELREATRTVGYPILPLIEQLSARSDPLVGSYLHWGATTQDIMDTGLALILDRALTLTQETLTDLIAALAGLATEHRSTLIAARTHAQQAVPTTLGAKIAVWMDEFGRHDERIRQARPRVIRVQLFGAAGTAAALGPSSREVRNRVAELLGLQQAATPWHTARDGLAELGFVLAAAACTCGKVAREVIELSRTEIGELGEALGEHRGASSTMPQKANPILSETIVGMSALARQQVPALLEAMQAGHERSAGEWQIEWDALPALTVLSFSALRNTLRLMQELGVFPDRMAANLQADSGMLMSEAVMIALAPTLGRRQAHHVVYKACRSSRSRGITFDQALAETLDEATTNDVVDLDTLLEPRNYLGEAEALVDAALESVSQEASLR